MSSQLLSIFTDRDSTISLGDLFQCLTTVTVKKVGSCVKMEFCILISASWHPVTKHQWKKPSSLFFIPSHQVLLTWVRFPWTISSKLKCPSSLSHSSHKKWSNSLSLWHFAGLTPASSYFCCTGEPRTGHRTSGAASPVLRRGRITFPGPAGKAALKHSHHYMLQHFCS